MVNRSNENVKNSAARIMGAEKYVYCNISMLCEDKEMTCDYKGLHIV